MNTALTEEKMIYGRKRYLLFASINGFSVALLAESTLILYGLKIGIPDYLTGIMSSFLLLGMPFMLIGKFIISRKGLSKTVFTAWVCRSLCALISVSAPFFIEKFSLNTGCIIFLIGAYGFYAFRGVGVIGATPLVGEITEENNRGQFNAIVSMTFTSGYFISMAILIILFEYIDTVQIFQIVISIGCLLGIIAAFIISRTPETDTPKYSASVSLKESIILLLRIKQVKKVFFTRVLFQTIIALILPYSVILLKVTYNIRDFKAMQFVLLQMLGGIFVALITKKIISAIGPKLLILILYSIFIIPLLMWIVSPVKFNWYYCAFIFFIAGFAGTGGNISLTHYFLNAVPAENRISGMIVITAGASTIAGLVGGFIGGSILKILDMAKFSNLSTRETYFSIILILFFLFLFILMKIQKKRFIKSGFKLAVNSLFLWKKIAFNFLNLK